MGEVYRAHDSRLKRDVAIKILPEEFSRDPSRVSRFQREAEALAALNHQNIAGIYDLQQSEAIRFLVLEFVEGDTLADILVKRGKLPIDEALGIAKQICEALDAAHEKGLVHRDLKPANVKVMADGKVKVLDFGLAKALESAPADPVLSNSPTLSMAATNAGVILGTAAYMSPEQAKGRAVDRRSDIFAFGCVLFEMLAGRPTFEGDDVTEILSRVVTSEPNWNALPAETPASIQRLLRRALKKNPSARLSDVRDAKIEIEEAGMEPAAPAVVSSPARGSRLVWIALSTVAVLIIAALAIPAVRHLRETPAREMRVEINTPQTSAPLQFALSPDGTHLAFIASSDGPQRLWVRALDKTNAQPIAGTEGAEMPFWSADSRSIGFFTSSKLSRVDIAGGLPQSLAYAPRGFGGAWNADGTIVFNPNATTALFRISASGGEPVAITRLDPPRQLSHRFPQFLPDGRHFLFFVQCCGESAGIYLGSLDGGEPKRLTAADAAGLYLNPGRLLFIRQGALVAQPLNVQQATLTGDPVTLSGSAGYDTAFLGLAGLSTSQDGLVAFRGSGAARVQLTWFDRTGKVTGKAGEPDPGGANYPALSPDGHRVAISRSLQGNMDLWLLDLVRGGLMPFTFDPGSDQIAVWSPDGKQIAFSSNRKGAYNIYVKPANGVGAEQVVVENGNTKLVQAWSKDSRFLLYYEVDPKTARDLWVKDLSHADEKPRPVVKTPAEETLAQFSPDGRWIAYQTNESKRFEIVVQPFPEATAKWQVSTDGGVAPRWRADSRELYFIAPDSSMMAVPINAPGSNFEPGTPTKLFPTHITGGGSVSTNTPQYAVSADGRFLISQPVEGSIPSPITLILNWSTAQKQ